MIPPGDWSESETLAGAAVKPASSPSSASAFSSSAINPQPLLPIGSLVGNRYEILALLGEGGMGAVYKAHDRELGHAVALKTIRAELARNPEMLQRFKQEVILAREITHPNVVRIYDISEDAGTKFITMEFVDGEDLHSLLEQHGKFPPVECVELIRQVCSALDAAHRKGVIHRDLKPQNIMRDRQGRVVVMDFGLARGLESDGMTQTGAMVGTMAYMSPEQALGEKLDPRSDLFAAGLIFFELLTGNVPYHAESAVASLVKRSQSAAVRASEIDASVPVALSNIVAKCLERDRAQRYQTAGEIMEALDGWQSSDRARGNAVRGIALPKGIFKSRWAKGALAGLLALLAVGVGGVLVRNRIAQPSAKTAAVTEPIVSVAILPFRNASGDPQANWLGSSVAEMLVTDIGQSAQVRTIPAGRVDQILRDLHIGPESPMDAELLARIASFINADVVVSGTYVKVGGRIRLDTNVHDLKHDRNASLKSETAETELLGSIDTLAKSIRDNLSVPPEVANEMAATAFKPASKSLDALRAYDEGIELMRQGKYGEAVKDFQQATSFDATFAMAYSKQAESYAALGYDSEAQDASMRAVQLQESAPGPERHLIQATHFRILRDVGRATEAYRRLDAASPGNTDVQLTLARLYEDSRETDQARTYYDKVLSHDGKNVDALLGMGRVRLLAGDAQGSLDYLNRAQALAIQFDNDAQKGASLFFLGTALSMLNRPADALRNFQDALNTRRSLDDKGAIAQTLNSMAQVQQTLGQTSDAQKNYNEALRIRRQIGDKRGIANTLLDLGSFYEGRGQLDSALDLTKQSLQIQRELGDPQNEATCLNNIGWYYLGKGDYENANTYFQQALDIREKMKDQSAIADTVYNLAETASRMGDYDKGINYFLRSIELWRSANDKHGLAIAAYGMSTLFAYQGRYGAALSASKNALDSVRELKEQGFWLAQIQGNYGNALSLAGRPVEAKKELDEALQTARQLKNDALLARLLNYDGDRSFYAGDFGAARASFQQAAAAASRAKDRENALVAKVGLARVAAQENDRSAVRTLRGLSDEASRSGQKYLSLQCEAYIGEALIAAKDFSGARNSLESTLRTSERLNLKMLQARSHYLLGNALRLSSHEAEASSHYVQVRGLLEEMRKEAGGDALLRRSDIARMYSDTTQITRK